MVKIKKEIILKNMKRLLKTNDLMLVVKDDAYGFGIDLLVSLAKIVNVNHFAVKDIKEGIIVRHLYNDAKILILGKVFKNDINEIIKYRLIPTINDYDDYLLFKENNINAHLAIDTGMNRFGMKNGFLAIINDKIVKAIYTHCYNKDNEPKIRYIESLGRNYLKDVHIGGSIAYNKTKSMLRVGKIIYENSLYFYGKIVNIKKLRKNECLGYDSIFKAYNDCIIGVCNVGYSDGLNLYYHGSVIIKDKYYSVVGKCCMDQCFILIDEGVNLEDEVEFFGKNISEDEFIRNNNMSKYEMFLQINQQVITN